MNDLGKLLIVCGILLIGVGALLTCAGKIPWLGKLPGDIAYKGEDVTVYFPIVTCALLSVVLSVLFTLFRR